ncbi:hypothetical protein Ahy_B02g059213 [Arachis hypogaea]|uniref:Large ribosomal subunit protein bL9 C-terminal domain-containing protein n=1 Tax=Arachis hypogaea TaxID=3818 RepID=A0A445AG93_ARAHY|nr:hypothetical protein Ahy_B02g059213 [Arachis hypogaea]
MKLEEERIEAEKRWFLVLQVKEEAQQLAQIFEIVGDFKVKQKAGKEKLTFESVTAQDLVDIIKAQLHRYHLSDVHKSFSLRIRSTN